MKNLTGNQIRQMFLDYFASKGHMVEPGASLVPHNDPTLLWINAGVAALKKYFDGSEKPKCNRITNAQKSIRTNDIENVGKTARHHTFFEMLGNFSIGDYFKQEAIPFAWEFLTSEEWMAIPKEKLYVSVYTDDTEAYDIWVNKVGIDPSHILKTYDNFWEIGEGPSGPDSEIFFDRGPPMIQRDWESVCSLKNLKMIVISRFGMSCSHNMMRSLGHLAASTRSFHKRISIPVWDLNV